MLAAKVGQILLEKELKLILAESCTGGLISHWITEIPGASFYYWGGVVAYSNALKESILGVSPETLRVFGAVSCQTAREMAEGARLHLSHGLALDSVISLSITGIAGPSGGSLEKPVGLVWFALATPEETMSWSFIFKGDRSQIKRKAARKALTLLIEHFSGSNLKK